MKENEIKIDEAKKCIDVVKKFVQNIKISKYNNNNNNNNKKQ
jgi:hypothetical protein